MGKVLFISDSAASVKEIKALCGDILTVKSAAKAMELIDRRDDIDSVIIEYPSRKRNVRKLIETVGANNNYIYSIAILLLTDRENAEKDARFIGGAVVDCFIKPLIPEIFLNRLKNVGQFISSVSFSEFSRMLKVLPSNIYLKDINGRYVFSSQTWHHLDTKGDPNWTIKGKTDIDVRKDKENAKIAMESDRKLIESGKGTSYLIEEKDGEQEFLQIIKEPLFFEDGRVRGIIALINNVTEQEQMRRELKERSIRDNMTGVYNRSCFDEYIESICDDAFPISIISADCDNLKFINDTYGHMIGDEYIRMSATLLRTSLPESSRVFRVGGDEFIALMPYATPARLKKLIEAMKRTAGSCLIKGSPLRISFGYSTADSAESMQKNIHLADSRMYADKKKNKQALGAC